VVAVEVHDSLDGALLDEVHALIRAVEDRDSGPPLSEHAVLQVAQHRPGLRHLVARHAQLVGYAQLDGDTAEIADLDGSATVLLGALENVGARLVWSHGRHSPVGPAARARGYAEHRVLWQVRRPLRDLPAAPLPDGVRLRAFVPDQDEDAWLAVNAAAFADHPEQGRFTRADLEARKAEPWFDPAGFLLAVRDVELLGFHWTKVHPHGIGEVYVLGVAPQAQGMRLGPALLAAGLAHLAVAGLSEAMLYVEQDNATAMRLYEQFGFARHDVDIQYEWTPGAC
jgi:mycothiol synthase